MTNPTVYIKTPKGLEEMITRRHGLGLKERKVLILVDGKRDAAALSRLFDDAPQRLDSLAANGFIAPLTQPVAEPAAIAAPETAPPAQRASPRTEHERFDLARNFMLNTINAYVGVVASSLSESLEQSESIEDLRKLFFAWRDAIELSRDGRKALPELEKRLAALLS